MTKTKPCGTDVVSLREYLEGVVEQERVMREQVISSNKEAVDLARESINERLNSMNELRQQVNSERGTFFTNEAQARYAELVQVRFDALSSKVNIGIGIILALQAIVGLAVVFLKRG